MPDINIKKQVKRWNTRNPRYMIAHNPLTGAGRPSVRPFVLYLRMKSGAIDYVARYKTLDGADAGVARLNTVSG